MSFVRFIHSHLLTPSRAIADVGVFKKGLGILQLSSLFSSQAASACLESQVATPVSAFCAGLNLHILFT